ncbi:MAG: BCCT family transporter, partial [Agrobacterium sp.]|nr:BCCT family transporter [Agrobacterium sp.]
MAATIFHWGLHPWAIYAIVALALALFSYNKGLPLTLRSIFYPIFGERVWGWPGHIIDILAVFATLFGLRHLGWAARAGGCAAWTICSALPPP